MIHNSLFFVLAHNIRSLHNVGSIFRTSDVFVVSKLFLTGYTGHPSKNFKDGSEYNLISNPTSERLSKVSLGAEETVPWEYNKSAIRVINKLKKEYPKLSIVGLENNLSFSLSWQGEGEGERSKFKIHSLPAFKPRFPILLVLGEEVAGISKPLLKLCDYFVEIPQYGQKESLNVSVAFGIAAYSIRVKG